MGPMPCMPPMSCTPFMPHSPPSTLKPSRRLPSSHVLPAPLELPRSSTPSLLASPVAPGNVVLRCCPTRALPHLPLTRVQTRGVRRVGQSLIASGRVATCTKPEVSQGPARDNKSTGCRRRGYALWQCFRPPPCVRPATLHNPTRQWQRPSCLSSRCL